MPSIRQLPAHVVNKIAAGEVVERPASVVKELVENSVDAGATRIDVTVEGGGTKLVRVVDDGLGIPADQLSLAVASHATSKIATAEDLFRVATFGFRGEALASIAAVSRLLIRSRPPGTDAAQLQVVGGEVYPVTPSAGPLGTCVEVRDLFFNTPVRRRFLRSVQTELGHATEAMARIALALPQVHFTFRHNDRVIYDLPPCDDRRERIAAVVGRPLADDLIWVQRDDGPVRLAGYAAHPRQSRAGARMQYLFLNGRYIRDRALQHALGEAYRGLLTTGRHPIAFLWLEMPPEMADVNVHPTKLEVRFEDGGRLYSQLLSALRSKFLSMDLTVRIEPDPQSPAQMHDARQSEQIRRQVVDWAKGQIASWEAGAESLPAAYTGGCDSENWGQTAATGPPAVPFGGSGQQCRAGAPLRAGEPGGVLELAELDRCWPAAEGDEDDLPADELPAPAPQQQATAAESPFGGSAADVGISAQEGEGNVRPKAMQIHDSYLVVETEEGVMLIDQHALHERILYEQLRRRMESGPLESQRMLVPEPVDLPPAEAAAALEHRQLLAELGILIDPFGGNTVLVCGYPAVLSGGNSAEMLQAVLGPIMEAGQVPDRRMLLETLLQRLACKAAVKAGDRLAPEEIQSLLAQRHLIDDPHHCPHGRPAALVWSRRELDRRFRRV